MPKRMIFAIIMGCCLFLYPLVPAMAGNGQPVEGHIPVGDVFSVDESKTSESSAPDEQLGPMSMMLGGLIISVFLVAGVCRTYYHVYRYLDTQRAAVSNERRRIIADKVNVDTRKIIEMISEYEAISSELVAINEQISMIGGKPS